METGTFKLTVLFEDPFWIGLFERQTGSRYEVCKITFGAEPRDCQVWQFVLESWSRLEFSPAVRAEAAAEKAVSPKRMQRLIQRQTADTGIGTKAQQALKLQQEQNKQDWKIRSRDQREAAQDRKFQLRQEKRKEKHRGR